MRPDCDFVEGRFLYFACSCPRLCQFFPSNRWKFAAPSTKLSIVLFVKNNVITHEAIDDGNYLCRARIVESSLDHQNPGYFIGRKKFNNATQQWRRLLFKLNISRKIDVILYILKNLITKTHRVSVNAWKKPRKTNLFPARIIETISSVLNDVLYMSGYYYTHN